MAYRADLPNLLIKRINKLIPANLLRDYHARLVITKKDQILFDEGDPARDFLQVEKGQVRMYVLNSDGQEFTQGVFGTGESFGEPALLGGFAYPSSAMVTVTGSIWRLPKANFLSLLKGNFEIHMKLDQVLCKRLQYKSMILSEVSSHNPEHRLMTVLTYLKSKIVKKASNESIVIPFTRQQLADMTGLRVETVIRSIKKMESAGTLKLQGHKITF